MNSAKKALVIFSGGQDSTTCLYWAIREYGKENIQAISFDYGQRHKIELDCAKTIAAKADIKHRIIPINTFEHLTGNSLTGDIEVKNELDDESQLPNTFVPGRNLIFLTFAAAYAYQKKITNLVTGVAQTDYSGYPDCREETIVSLEKTISLGMEYELEIKTPLMFLSKKETVELAKDLDALTALADSHTCYNGVKPPCGHCSACILRAKGFEQAGIEDPLMVS